MAFNLLVHAVIYSFATTDALNTLRDLRDLAALTAIRRILRIGRRTNLDASTRLPPGNRANLVRVRALDLERRITAS